MTYHVREEVVHELKKKVVKGSSLALKRVKHLIFIIHRFFALFLLPAVIVILSDLVPRALSLVGSHNARS
jgi:hypothetical protein